MITVSIFINGKPIFTRSAVNKGKVDISKNAYRYAADDGSFIYHDPKDGAVALAKKMLDTIREKDMGEK